MIVLYNTNFTHNANAYLNLAIERDLEAMLGAGSVVRADNRTLLPLTASGSHDILLCIDGQRLDRGLIARARPGFRRTILWTFEDPFMLDYNIAHEDLFDHVFTNDSASADFYGTKGRFLPLAASSALHHREILDDDKLRYDIFFAGTVWPNRVPALLRLIEAFPEARFKLACPTNDFLPPLPAAIAERALVHPISHEAFIDFANRSRVTLTAFRDYASHGEASLAMSPGPRLYELGLAGTAQVVLAARMPKAVFRDMPGIALCDGPDGIVHAVRRLLDDPAHRRASAVDTQRAVVAHHTYRHRIREMLDLVGETAPAPARSPDVKTTRLRVLMCTHSTVRNEVWGGVEVYQETLATVLADDVEVLFWLRDGQSSRLVNRKGEVLEQFELPGIGWLDVLCDAEEERAFSDAISAYRIDVVHFQHLGHHAASLPIIAKATGVGVVMSVHDFFLACARYNLLDYNQRYCRIDEKSVGACDVCLRVGEGLPEGSQQQRRLFLEQVLRSVDTLLFGSMHSERLLRRMYPQIADTHCLQLGIPVPPSALVPPRASVREVPGQRRTLRVAVIGNFIRSKGADTILNVIGCADPQLFEFHVYGHVEPQYATALESRRHGSVTLHGRHKPGDAGLVALDVSLHLSIWPETYCITLSEAWKAGLIPIVTDTGALSERVDHAVNGFKVGVDDASAVVDTLELLRALPSLCARIRENIGAHLWVEAHDYSRKLLAEYRSVASARTLGAATLSMDVGQLHILPKRTWRELTGPRHILDAQRANPLVTQLPVSVEDWPWVQGAELFIDSVCDEPKPPAENGLDGVHRFSPRRQLVVEGWTFVPDVRITGVVYVALVPRRSSQHVIFVRAERVSRPDLRSAFPSAPERAGFLARAHFNGKWCDGVFDIGIVNILGSKAAFQLSTRSLRVHEGFVVDLRTSAPDNDAILASFAQVYAAVPRASPVGGTPPREAPSVSPVPTEAAPELAPLVSVSDRPVRRARDGSEAMPPPDARSTAVRSRRRASR